MSHSDGDPAPGSIAAVLALALLTPVGYLGYVVFVRWAQGNPTGVRPLFSTQMGLYVLVLLATGLIAGVANYLRLRVTPPVVGLALLVWPWVYLSIPIGNVGYVSIPLVGAALVFAAELGITDGGSLPRSAALGVAAHFEAPAVIAAGALHLLFGFALHGYTRRFIFFRPGVGLVGYLPGAVLYLVLGLVLVLTGALPVALWRAERLVLPGATAAGWALWGIYGTWLTRSWYPLGEFTGFGWFGPGLRPYPDYVIGITELLLVLIVVAAAEYLARQVIGAAQNHRPG